MSHAGNDELKEKALEEEETVTLKPRKGKVYYGGKVYYAKIDGDYNEEWTKHILGTRLTDCCEAASTYEDEPILECKVCRNYVGFGEGDGSEKINGEWKLNKKKDAVLSCTIKLG